MKRQWLAGWLAVWLAAGFTAGAIWVPSPKAQAQETPAKEAATAEPRKEAARPQEPPSLRPSPISRAPVRDQQRTFEVFPKNARQLRV